MITMTINKMIRIRGQLERGGHWYIQFATVFYFPTLAHMIR